MEVAMRPAEVFVRALSPEEGARLKSISRKAKEPVQASASDHLVGVLDGHLGAADRGDGTDRRVACAQGRRVSEDSVYGKAQCSRAQIVSHVVGRARRVDRGAV